VLWRQLFRTQSICCDDLHCQGTRVDETTGVQNDLSNHCIVGYHHCNGPKQRLQCTRISLKEYTVRFTETQNKNKLWTTAKIHQKFELLLTTTSTVSAKDSSSDNSKCKNVPSSYQEAPSGLHSQGSLWWKLSKLDRAWSRFLQTAESWHQKWCLQRQTTAHSSTRRDSIKTTSSRTPS